MQTSLESFNRLTSAGEGAWSRNFSYDAWGNMWAAGSGVGLDPTTPTMASNYNSSNRLATGSYDGPGNQWVVNGNTLAYDGENRIFRVTEPASLGGAVETFSYDGDGKRVQKVGPSGTTVYVYDAQGQLAAEYTNATPAVSPCTTCYLTADHLGSTRLVTDGNGNVIARHDYLPFGEEIPAGIGGRTAQWGAGTDTVEARFTGQVRDQETGLDYFGARYYGGALGRFTSPDPLLNSGRPWDPQTWNRYSYARNNPLAMVDPTGLYGSEQHVCLG